MRRFFDPLSAPSTRWPAPVDAPEVEHTAPPSAADAVSADPLTSGLAPVAKSQRPQEVIQFVAGRAAVLPSTSQGQKLAQQLGLEPLYRELLGVAVQRAGLSRPLLAGLGGRTYQVTRDTPIGFALAAGQIRWPHNQSEGRHLGLAMTRTIIMRPGDNPAIVKVKGAGQAFDHAQQQTQRINDRPRPPIPYALLWNRDFLRTGTPHFALQEELARQEFKHILTVHALSKRVFGRLASAPVPVDVTRDERVMMRDRDVSLVRARGDLSLWQGYESYGLKDREDYFFRLKAEAPERIRHAATLEAFAALARQDPIELQRELLDLHGMLAPDLSDEDVRAKYPHLLLARHATEQYPLAQIVLVERGQFRNNISKVWSDPALSFELGGGKDRLVDATIRQFLHDWGMGAALAPHESPAQFVAKNRDLVKKRIAEQMKEVGRMYGMVRAFGAEVEAGFHPKDLIGAEITDWVDYDMPLPNEKPKLEWRPLNDWKGYHGGVDENVDCVLRMFGLDAAAPEFKILWRQEARRAARLTVEAGLAGRLDDLLGGHADNWKQWIAAEIAAAQPEGSSLRDALAGASGSRKLTVALPKSPG